MPASELRRHLIPNMISCVSLLSNLTCRMASIAPARLALLRQSHKEVILQSAPEEELSPSFSAGMLRDLGCGKLQSAARMSNMRWLNLTAEFRLTKTFEKSTYACSTCVRQAAKETPISCLERSWQKKAISSSPTFQATPNS